MRNFKHNLYVVNDPLINGILPFTQLNLSLTNRNSNCSFNEWDVQENNWQENLKGLEDKVFQSIIIPSHWFSKTDFNLDAVLINRIENGTLRILSFVKKNENIICNFPCLFIPLDRGRYIENIFLGLAANPNWNSAWPLLSKESRCFEIDLKGNVEEIKKLNLMFFKDYGKIFPGISTLELKNRVAIRRLLKVFNIGKESQYQIAGDKSILNVSLSFPLQEFEISKLQKSKKLKAFGLTCSCYWLCFDSNKNELMVNYIISFDSERFISYPSFSNPFALGLVKTIKDESGSNISLEKMEVDKYPGLYEISMPKEIQKESEFSDLSADIFEELIDGEEAAPNDGDLFNIENETPPIPIKEEIVKELVVEEIEVVEELDQSVDHLIYFIEESIIGRGIKSNDLEDSIRETEATKLKKWKVEQFEWEEKIEKLNLPVFTTFFLPDPWTMDIEEEPPLELAENIEDGKCRIIIPSIKNDLAIYNFPLFRLPTDRGPDILKILWPITYTKFYLDLEDLFLGNNVHSYDSEIFSEEDTLLLYKEILDKLFERNPKAEKERLNINLIASSMVNLIYSEVNIDPRRKTKVKCIVGENVVGFSFRWESKCLTYFDWTAERTDLQRIFKTCSCIWFNIFPKDGIVEAIILFNVGPDRNFSYPLGSNLYPMGVEIIGPDRLTKESTKKEFLDIKEASVPVREEKQDAELDIDTKLKTKFYCFVSEEALTLRGVTYKFFSDFLNKEYPFLKISKLNSDQDTIFEKALKNYSEGKVFILIIPTIWLVDYNEVVPDRFKKLVNEGKFRIATMVEKSDPPYYGHPYFNIPTDRGEHVLKKVIQSFFNPVYMGIFSFNPIEESIIVTKPLRHLENVKDIVEETIDYFLTENDQVGKIKSKINMVLKGLGKWIFKEEGLPEIFFQFILDSKISNILTCSVRWKTHKESSEFFCENKTWKSLSMAASAFWFNQILDSNEIEAFFLFSLAKDSDFSFPLPKNSFPLGFDIVLSERISREIHCETTSINKFPSLLVGKLEPFDSVGDIPIEEQDLLMNEALPASKSSNEKIIEEVNEPALLINNESEGQSKDLNTIQDDIHIMKNDNIINDEIDKIAGTKEEDLAEKTFKVKGNPEDAIVDTKWVSKIQRINFDDNFSEGGGNPLCILFIGRSKQENNEYSRVFNEKKIKVNSLLESSKAISSIKLQEFSLIIVCSEIAKGNVDLLIKSIKNPGHNNEKTPIILLMNKVDLEMIKLNKKRVDKVLSGEATPEELFFNLTKLVPKVIKKKK